MKKLQLLLGMLMLYVLGSASAPIILYPHNSIDTQAVKLTFAFHPVANMQYYDVQVDTTPFFNSPLLKDSVGTSDYSSLNSTDTVEKVIYNLYYGTKQYWRVRGRNASDTTEWSSTYVFTTRAFPLIIQPTNNFAFSSLASTVLIFKNIGGTNQYQVQVGSTSVFISPIYIYLTTNFNINYPHFNNVTVGLSSLPPSSDYYVKVKAYNAVDSSEWTPEIHFTVLNQTSVSENETHLFKVYPNPSMQKVNIISKENLPIYIYNESGVLVYESKLSAIDSQIDISNLPQGNYFIQILDSDKVLVQKLVIVE